jgi:hypothetical protein
MIRLIVPLVCLLSGLVLSPAVLGQSPAFPDVPALSVPPASEGASSQPVTLGMETSPLALVAGGDQGGQDVSKRRDPFWPVGYVPKVVKKAPVGPKSPKGTPVSVVEVVESPRVPHWEEAMRKLDIRGVSLIGRDKESGKSKYLAMVTGRLVEEGDVVNVAYSGRIYRWKVTSIGSAGVAFQKLDVRSE